MTALERLALPVVIWNAPLVERLGADLDQAASHEHTTVISAVMLGNVLVRLGHRVVSVTASPANAIGVQRVHAKINRSIAGNVLEGGVLLRIGDPIPGYLDIETSKEQLESLGLRERRIDETELVRAFWAVRDEEIDELRNDIASRGWLGEPDERSIRLAVVLLALAAQYEAIGGTVNCHGPFFRFGPDVGICACLGVSLATARGMPFSCTGDQATAVALVLGRWTTGAALYCETFAPELATGLALIGNGGEGDPAWASDDVHILPSQHYPGLNGRGTSLSFALRRGPCTVLSVSPGLGGWRGVWIPAEVVETRYSRMLVPNAMLRFSKEPDVGRALDLWIASGATHHQALLPGDAGEELSDALAACGIEPIGIT
jgi:L-arabinose isomerase